MKDNIPIFLKATPQTTKEDAMFPISLSPQPDRHKTHIFRLWLNNSLFFGTGCATALLADNMTALFHACLAFPSEFITLIQQTQVANAMQSIEGIIQIVGFIFAGYAFCYRRASTKKTQEQPEKLRDNE
jgi:positive regulator of sigma E activity